MRQENTLDSLHSSAGHSLIAQVSKNLRWMFWVCRKKLKYMEKPHGGAGGWYMQTPHKKAQRRPVIQPGSQIYDVMFAAMTCSNSGAHNPESVP